MGKVLRFLSNEVAYNRAMTKTTPGHGGCIICTYSTGSHGYAQVGYGTVLAHRVVWEWHHGAIPDGMHVDHTCHQRRCINIHHLRLLTADENARAQYVGYREHFCIKGHDLRVTGVYKVRARPNGRGRCAECAREDPRRRQASRG